MTRICKIKGFSGFVGGKDNDNVFEEGVVYEVQKVLGEIILTPIGKQPKYSKGGSEIEMQTLSHIITDGSYLLPKENNETSN
jgi:hypothetical protein